MRKRATNEHQWTRIMWWERDAELWSAATSRRWKPEAPGSTGRAGLRSVGLGSSDAPPTRNHAVNASAQTRRRRTQRAERGIYSDGPHSPFGESNLARTLETSGRPGGMNSAFRSNPSAWIRSNFNGSGTLLLWCLDVGASRKWKFHRLHPAAIRASRFHGGELCMATRAVSAAARIKRLRGADQFFWVDVRLFHQ